MADRVSVSPITDDMVAKAERVAHEVHEAWRVTANRDAYVGDAIRRAATEALSAALAGCTVVQLPEDAEHLQVVRSARGFSRLPALPTAYGGEIKVYESSAASAPHLWLLTTERDGHEAPAHLTVETAHQLVQQLLHTIANHYQGAAGSQVGDQHGHH